VAEKFGFSQRYGSFEWKMSWYGHLTILNQAIWFTWLGTAMRASADKTWHRSNLDLDVPFLQNFGLDSYKFQLHEDGFDLTELNPASQNLTAWIQLRENDFELFFDFTEFNFVILHRLIDSCKEYQVNSGFSELPNAHTTETPAQRVHKVHT